jgi:hypothetical protein
VADSLFERSILTAIPSCLSRDDENDIITAFEKTLAGCGLKCNTEAIAD